MIVLQSVAESTLDGNRNLGSLRAYEGLSPAPGIQHGLHLTVPNPGTSIFRLTPDPVTGTHAALIPLATRGRGHISWVRHGVFNIEVYPGMVSAEVYVLALRGAWMGGEPRVQFVMYEAADPVDRALLEADKSVVIGILVFDLLAVPIALTQLVPYGTGGVVRSTRDTRGTQGSLREVATTILSSSENVARIQALSGATFSVLNAGGYRSPNAIDLTDIDGASPGQIGPFLTARVQTGTRLLVCLYGVSNVAPYTGLSVRFTTSSGTADVPFGLPDTYQPIWVEITVALSTTPVVDVAVSIYGTVDGVPTGTVVLDSLSLYVSDYTQGVGTTTDRASGTTSTVAAVNVAALGDPGQGVFQMLGGFGSGEPQITILPPGHAPGDPTSSLVERAVNDVPNGELEGLNLDLSGGYKQRGVLTPMCVAAGVIDCDETDPPAFFGTPFNMTAVEFNGGDIRITLPFAFDSGVHTAGSEGVVVTITYECLGTPVLNLITRQSTVTNTGPSSTRITIRSWDATNNVAFGYGVDTVKSLVIKVLVHGVTV